MTSSSSSFAPIARASATGRVDTVVNPEGTLAVLSQAEVADLCDSGYGELYGLFRRCALAVLNSASYVDDAKTVLEEHRDFEIRLSRQQRGIRLALRNAPAQAMVDGKMIRGIREHLFSVLRDILFVANEIERSGSFDLTTSSGLTDAVFSILRHAGTLKHKPDRGLVVCWGGHSIGREEYDYTKEVGYELGLRGLDICTGCGPGAMKGPMKGAAVGHAKQRITDGRYIGITEPGIIAAEPPNPIVRELVIMPDMEKRLEAFVRCGHAVISFPGGPGTAEEILYLLGILSNPDNADLALPLVLTGPASSAAYFDELLAFIEATLGADVLRFVTVIIDDPSAVARHVADGIADVLAYRREHNDAPFFNWLLNIDSGWQIPFEVSHASMADLQLHRSQPVHELALSLRRAFTGIVAGNVKDEGIRAVEREGPYLLRGDPAVMGPLDALLNAFVEQQRMRLPGRAYRPCYEIATSY